MPRQTHVLVLAPKIWRLADRILEHFFQVLPLAPPRIDEMLENMFACRLAHATISVSKRLDLIDTKDKSELKEVLTLFAFNTVAVYERFKDD